ncbi:MAG: hypothetical protein KKC68_02840, partial [Candidatus Thermoplasmatota archaeon]|nr:hypothetical protein [Candidatus Thermoplasmatota archaeon]
SKKWAIITTLLLLGTTFFVPVFSSAAHIYNKPPVQQSIDDNEEFMDINPMDLMPYDTYFVPEEEPLIRADQNDINYNRDAGDEFNRAFSVYIGEPVDTAPGRGRTGYLNPSDGDSEDYYRFSVCVGQTIISSLITSESYDFTILDHTGTPVSNGYTAIESNFHYIGIYTTEGGSLGEYTFSVILGGQNDAGIGNDAGDSIELATPIVPGSYTGYMDVNDWEDWYSFDVTTGEGIFVTVEPFEKTDFDIYLYTPSNEQVFYAQYYGDDSLEFPADATGMWKIKLDIFPGWNTGKWPDDYYLYGSGVYDLEISIGGTADEPPTLASQPDIYPVARTFIVDNDPNSNSDEYCYIAAVPAANYVDDNKRYVAPIVYRGDTTQTNWFGTVDDTTQYLLDDWNSYLARHAITAEECDLSEDPITAAAEIATMQWISSETAVVVVDGSTFEDSIKTRINKNVKLNAKVQAKSIPPDSTDLISLSGLSAIPMFIGPQWGCLVVHGLGTGYAGDIGIVTPRYEALMDDWWPYPNDANGPDLDVCYPITVPGFWLPYTTSLTGLTEMQVSLIAGKRFRVPITSTDCSLKVTVTTDTPSCLNIYLVDPYGNVRRPTMPHWNGGPINPLHMWNGGHWSGIGFDDWRALIPLESTGHSEEVHYPMEGIWRVIVVPAGLEYADQTYDFHITAEVRNHAQKRTAAALSAANGAVIASAEHIPLLYVTENSVPPATESALTTLGVSNIIFVGIDNLGNGAKNGLSGYTLTDFTTLEDTVSYIDDCGLNEDNFITITSLASGDGYFAPSAMIAAYHSSPVLSIGEAIDAYNKLDMITAWREYAGDYYHGCRSVGHLPLMSEAFDLKEFIEAVKNKEYPAPGFDLKKRWYTAVNQDITEMINHYGLEKEGQEAYLFVAPRDTDIRSPVCRAMTGNNSFAGHIPVETPAFASAIICRDILYPALIYANPGRNTTTSQLMNYPDGGSYGLNNGQSYNNYATRELKQIYSSHERFYEGHSIWDNYLARMNNGTSISYYAGHGTGGSGISAQYKNIKEQFPQCEPRYENIYDFDWWDGWRGYSGYDGATTKCPRTGGSSSYNSQEPSLYDIIHFKWVDQTFDNLHSELEFWSSCATGEHFGPMIYLEHGSALWYGNCGSGYGIQTTIHDNWMFYDVLVKGESFGEAHS